VADAIAVAEIIEAAEQSAGSSALVTL